MRLNDITKETFFTPEELSERLKLSTATVYKLLTQDKLPYFKIGKSYRIPAQAFFAYMLAEGNLTRFVSPSPVIPDTARAFVEAIGKAPEKLRDQIDSVVLFGSYARGTQTADSDIDLLVLVKENTSEIEQQLASLSSEAMASFGFDEFLSPIRMSLAHWEELSRNGSPLYDEISREGIVLWSNESRLPKGIENVHARN